MLENHFASVLRILGCLSKNLNTTDDSKTINDRKSLIDKLLKYLLARVDSDSDFIESMQHDIK